MTRYLLEIEVLDDDLPAEIRLRRLLKVMLRHFHLKCASISEIPSDAEKARTPRNRHKHRGETELANGAA